MYDEYIDRRKLSEQKKNSWVYSSSPAKVGRSNKQLSLLFWKLVIYLHIWNGAFLMTFNFS